MSLAKKPIITVTPGDPGHPGFAGIPDQPAYCVTNYVSSCDWVLNQNVEYVAVTIGGLNVVVPTLKNTSPTVNSKVIASPYTRECSSKPVSTCYPATPGKPAIPYVPPTPAQFAINKRHGWENNRARSRFPLEVGNEIRFKVSPASMGVFIGFDEDGKASQPIRDFKHGLMIDADGVRVYENGVFVHTLAATFAASTEIVAAREWPNGTRLIYKITGGAKYISATPITGVQYAYVSLYSSDDVILEAGYALTAENDYLDDGAVNLLPITCLGSDVDTVDGVVSLKPLAVFGSDYQDGIVVLRPLQVSGVDDGIHGNGAVKLMPLSMTGADFDYQEGRVRLGLFNVLATGDQYIPPSIDNANVRLLRLVVSGMDTMLDPGDGAVTLKPLNAVAADHDYAEARVQLMPLRTNMEEMISEMEVFMVPGLLVYARDKESLDMLVTMRADGQIASTLTADRVLIEQMLSQLATTAICTVTGEYYASLIGSLAAMPELAGSTRQAMLDETARVWVVNLDGAASTQYEGYGFNSYFVRDGISYGVGDDGIYRLNGSDDQGDMIEAFIELGKTRYLDGHEKSVPYVYAHAASGGKLLLKVVSDDGSPYYYEARSSSAALGQHRFDIGKGLKGVAWSFTLMNQDGGDFELASLEFKPIASRRRV